MGGRGKISGVVISYSRADVIETTLRSLWFVDELIVMTAIGISTADTQ